jgi:hypothetical protein
MRALEMILGHQKRVAKEESGIVVHWELVAALELEL